MGNAGHQRIDIAVGTFQLAQVIGDPVMGQALTALRQMGIDLGQQAQMGIGQGIAEIRYLADIPEALDLMLCGGTPGDGRVL